MKYLKRFWTWMTDSEGWIYVGLAIGGASILLGMLLFNQGANERVVRDQRERRKKLDEKKRISREKTREDIKRINEETDKKVDKIQERTKTVLSEIDDKLKTDTKEIRERANEKFENISDDAARDELDELVRRSRRENGP
jgi:hypothetical protein